MVPACLSGSRWGGLYLLRGIQLEELPLKTNDNFQQIRGEHPSVFGGLWSEIDEQERRRSRKKGQRAVPVTFVEPGVRLIESEWEHTDTHRFHGMRAGKVLGSVGEIVNRPKPRASSVDPLQKILLGFDTQFEFGRGVTL
jgi:hypothetical protein